jgi:hypothetical protein
MTQISNMPNCGYGCGHVYGHRDGSGYGDSYGYWKGWCGKPPGIDQLLMEHGDTYGRGYRDGSGYGNCADSYGSGFGSAYGDGSPCGDGTGHAEFGDRDTILELIGDSYVIGNVYNYDVEWLPLFGLARVGCQTFSLKEWRENWEYIANDFEVVVEADKVYSLLEKCKI